MLDYSVKGKRIELVHTDDPYTKLKKGDKGTCQFLFNNLGSLVLQVKWDSGSNLGLIFGKDDFNWLDKEFE